MGGAFDPVHFGHLRTAIEMRQAVGFSNLLLVPTGRPVHRAQPVAPDALRLSMLHAAVEDLSWCSIDDQELLRPGPSYSIDTLQAMHKRWPQKTLCLIIGMDAFMGLPEWHRWTELTDFAHLLVASRPGWSSRLPPELNRWLQQRQVEDAGVLHTAPSGHVFIYAVTALEIASSAIRAQLQAGEDPRFLLPDKVLQIAAESGCYRINDSTTASSGKESPAA